MLKAALILHFTVLFHSYVVDVTHHGYITTLFSIQTFPLNDVIFHIFTMSL